MIDDELRSFAVHLQQELMETAQQPGEERTIRDVFVEHVAADLEEAGVLEGGRACFHQARGMEVSGYDVSADKHTLALFGTILTQDERSPRVPRSQLEICVKRNLGFLDWALNRGRERVDQSSPVFDMVMDITEAWPTVRRVDLFVFTDGTVNSDDTPPVSITGVEANIHVWDIRRLHQLTSSGQPREPIHIDFEEGFGSAIPCLVTQTGERQSRTVLAVVPGKVLAAVYEKYRARLLELNVRSFLQLRGSVNRGIRNTLLNSPERFLSYNNGIAATASAIMLIPLEDGGMGIKSVTDFQIVNGGQTTASLHHALTKDKASLEEVFVQMKLTEVPPDQLLEVVPLISQYANSQNKVNQTDFSTNQPYHVELEKLSRTVWAPGQEGSHRNTRWFYERARGQFQNALSAESTIRERNMFKALHPLRQKLIKTDVAKFQLAWDQLPHTVSLDGEKAYMTFAARLAELPESKPENHPLPVSYFEGLIAKAILFKETDMIVADLRLGGYKINVVAYTVALLSERSGQRINLAEIWRNQRIPTELAATVRDLAPRVHALILNAPGNGNVGEWAKKATCWDAVRSMEWNIPDSVQKTLVTPVVAAASAPLETEVADIDGVLVTAMSTWADAEVQLSALDRRRLVGFAKLLAEGKSLTSKQHEVLLELYRSARLLGFREDERIAVGIADD